MDVGVEEWIGEGQKGLSSVSFSVHRKVQALVLGADLCPAVPCHLPVNVTSWLPCKAFVVK